MKKTTPAQRLIPVMPDRRKSRPARVADTLVLNRNTIQSQRSSLVLVAALALCVGVLLATTLVLGATAVRQNRTVWELQSASSINQARGTQFLTAVYLQHPVTRDKAKPTSL